MPLYISIINKKATMIENTTTIETLDNEKDEYSFESLISDFIIEEEITLSGPDADGNERKQIVKKFNGTKDELKDKIQEIEAYADDILMKTQSIEYEIDIKESASFNWVKNYLQKDVPYGNATAISLLSLQNNWQAERDRVKSKEWDGKIYLRGANITALWTMLKDFKGTGMSQARGYLQVIANVGQGCQTAMVKVQNDTQHLRDIHTELHQLDEILQMGNYNGIDNEN